MSNGNEKEVRNEKQLCGGKGEEGDLSVLAGGRSSAVPFANTRGYQTVVKTEDGTAGYDVYSDVITE
jgi:hypothetical protein